MSETAKPERRFQFSLRTMLIVVLMLSLPLSWFAVRMERARRQREAVRAIEELGGWTDDWVSPIELFLGRDGAPVRQASFAGTGADDTALRHICDLYYLEDLDLRGTKVTDTGVLCLTSLSYLDMIWLENTEVTPEGVKKLREALPNCKIVY